MSGDKAFREQIARLLDWEDAHVGFAAAVADIPPEDRGRQPAGLPYSPWQLVEHLRRTQRDILEFCRNPDYQELKWPDDYWPRHRSRRRPRRGTTASGASMRIGKRCSSWRWIPGST